jgi:hypothetical protein
MSLLLRKPVLIILAVIAIPILAFAWWLLSPLFLNTTVNEEFPLSATADMPSGVTQQEAEDIMEGMAKINMDAAEPMPEKMAEATVLASGKFRDGDSFHKGSGDVSLYRLANGDAVLRFEGLSVTNGPDLHILVSTHSDPMTKGELRDAGYSTLGPLKGNRGDQNYELPSDVDPDSIGSVIIYCMPFHVIFSVAPLSDQG